MVRKKKDDSSRSSEGIPMGRFENLLKSLANHHSRFLGELKRVSPLAVLSSLSMAVASLIVSSGLSYLALAQTFAIAASLLFLAAFTCSLAFRILSPLIEYIPAECLALLSYLFTGGGVMFLFLLTLEFLGPTSSVSTVVDPLLTLMVFALFILFIPFPIYSAKASKSEGLMILAYYLACVCFLSCGLYIIVELLEHGIISLSPPMLWLGAHLIAVLGITGLTSLAIILIAFIIGRRQSLKR